MPAGERGDDPAQRGRKEATSTPKAQRDVSNARADGDQVPPPPPPRLGEAIAETGCLAGGTGGGCAEEFAHFKGTVMQAGNDGLELLDDECRRLLASAHFGRVGFSAGALPAIQPGRFAVHRGRVVIPAVSGGRRATGCRGGIVAVQADGCGRTAGTVWSVEVVGPARVVTDPVEVAELDRLGPVVATATPAHCYITVEMAMVTGWCGRADPVLWTGQPGGRTRPGSAPEQTAAVDRRSDQLRLPGGVVRNSVASTAAWVRRSRPSLASSCDT